MAIPFLDFFKKAKARLGKPAPEVRTVVARAALPEKPAAERLSKTVMPNTTRTMAPADPFKVASGATKGRSRETPTPLVPTPEPQERAITLVLSDFLDQLPQASLKPRDSFDAARSITIKAGEIEKGMATGEPTALLISIYEQAPEIFREQVAPTDMTLVALPLDKVLQQFQALQVRGDQTEDQAVPQVETPFLQVTIEDTKRFGTSLAPLQTSAAPPVKLEHASARAFAKAEPEPVAQEKHSSKISGRRPISLTPPSGPVTSQGSDSAPPPTRIPFRLPPNGAGVPDSERVPASSGPPVPNPPAAPPKNAAPARIPFKMAPPGDALKPKLTLVPGVEPAETEAPKEVAEPSKQSGIKARLRLNVCLRNLPAFQLSGELPEISDDTIIELPFSLIEPQLASGRIAIEPGVFRDAIPEQFRKVFVVDATETPVLLPLQEVLQHLPTEALRMRQDQEQEDAIDHFDTPFSKHAKEDQKRFSKDGAPLTTPSAAAEAVAAPVSEPATAEAAKRDEPKLEVEPKASTPDQESEPAKPAGVEAENKGAGEDVQQKADAPEAIEEKSESPSKADKEPSVEAKSNAKEFVLRVSCLPGVTACSISFADGLTMAGNLPPGTGAEGLCAMAPSLLQKVEKHMVETNLGALTALTLHCSRTPLTFFMEGNVCLTVLHADRQLEQVTQEQLSEITKELAQMFA